MSLSIKNVVVDRIETANSESPIAVFKTGKKSKCSNDLFDAVFARTVKTAQVLRSANDDLIGVFYGKKGVKAFRASI